MSANQFNDNSDLGVGIGLRIPHYDHILSETPPVEWFEIISENFLIDGGRPLAILERILEKYTVIQHGVSLYFGSPNEVSEDHLKRLKELVQFTKTPWLTDHLCWGSVDGQYSHDLLPLPYTTAVAHAAAEKIMRVRDYLQVPISVENLSSYVEFTGSAMSEWEFLTNVVEAADCGILLDVNNIYVSSVNHKFDPYTYVDNIPLDRVAQIHIAGHSPHDRFIIDTHDRAPIDPVWELYAYVISKIGHTPTLLEWDAKIPSFDEVHKEAMKATQWLDQTPRTSQVERRQAVSGK
ncbi:MAG: DUF692 domain-containing protein [Bdellovibrionales bacterium]|nr:DUF692 domain-containing protein [Bdellovibrionales bacterium]